jgi:hypothetical protein
MKKELALILLFLTLLITGCTDSSNTHQQTIRRLQRENTKLHQDLNTAGSVSGTHGIVTVILGCGLAACLFALIAGRSQ